MSRSSYLNKGYSDYKGSEHRSDEWNRGSYANANGGYSDHVCRPVLVDAEGNKRPIIFYDPHDTETYVTKTETIIEEVRIPLVQDYRYISTANTEPIRDYGAIDRKVMPVSPDRARPPKFEEFITEIQTEAGKPTPRINLGAAFGLKPRYGDNNRDEWIKPSQNDYYRRNDNTQEAGMIPTGGRVMPNQANWATPIETAISKATPTSQPRFSVPVPQVTKRDGYADTYVTKRDNFGYARETNGPTRPAETRPTINSREAVFKYGGVRLEDEK